MPILIVCCAAAAHGMSSAARAIVRSMVSSSRESRTIPKEMKRSTARILTTHVGTLPLVNGESVEAVVRRQREVGLDLINEGEYTKGGDWLSYVEARFGGFEPRPPAPGAVPLNAQGRDRGGFADFYRYA